MYLPYPTQPPSNSYIAVDEATEAATAPAADPPIITNLPSSLWKAIAPGPAAAPSIGLDGPGETGPAYQTPIPLPNGISAVYAPMSSV